MEEQSGEDLTVTNLSQKVCAVLSIFVLALVIGCTMSKEPQWNSQTIMGSNDLWPALVRTVLTEFPDLVISDSKAQYLQTTWKTTSKCWRGLLYGGYTTCERARAKIKLHGMNLSVMVEKETYDSTAVWLTSGLQGEKWVRTGNHNEMENRLITKIQNAVLFGNL